MFLGVPFNIASYALLAHIIAELTGIAPKTLTITVNHAHIYDRHVEQCEELLRRRGDGEIPTRSPRITVPKLRTIADVEASTWRDYVIEDYEHAGVLKGEVVV